jgi:hypothetical protein
VNDISLQNFQLYGFLEFHINGRLEVATKEELTSPAKLASYLDIITAHSPALSRDKLIILLFFLAIFQFQHYPRSNGSIEVRIKPF